MTIFAVQYTYDARSEVRDEARPEHRQFLSGLHDAGTLLSSGPFAGPPPTSTGAAVADAAEGALLIVRAQSAQAVAAELIAEVHDPAVEPGHRHLGLTSAPAAGPT